MVMKSCLIVNRPGPEDVPFMMPSLGRGCGVPKTETLFGVRLRSQVVRSLSLIPFGKGFGALRVTVVP